MSVASKNPFALLNDDEDEGKKSAPTKAKDETPVEQNKAASNRKPTSTRGGRYYQRGGPKPAPTSPPVDSADPTSPTGTGEKRGYRGDRGDRGDRPPRGDRGERGERARGRGRGRGRGGDRPDRHSATGITDTQKKVHQGWGGDRGDSEYKDETAGAADATVGDAWGTPAAETGDAADPWAEPAGGDASGEPKEDKPAGDDEGRRKKRFDEEEDDGTMTFAEYRAKQAPAEGESIPKLELRQANEGASDLFKGAKQLLKDPEADSYFVGKQAKAGGAPKARKEGKQYIDIDARFEPPSRGGRGRGGRGGRGEYRGRGDRGGRNRSEPQQVNMDDTSAFPALS